MEARTKTASHTGESLENRTESRFLFDYWLYEQLRRKGRSQKWLADRANICPSAITLYLERQRVPTLATFFAILDALDVEMTLKDK